MQTPDTIITVDLTESHLPGEPLAVTLVLPHATWEALTAHLRDFLRIGFDDDSKPDLGLSARIETMLEDAVDEWARCRGVLPLSSSANEDDEVPF
ncbi:MAG: hypothetical protein E2598_06105 [Sphingobium sp.]|nr:hypothetical protein [Sphingobium sp.]